MLLFVCYAHFYGYINRHVERCFEYPDGSIRLLIHDRTYYWANVTFVAQGEHIMCESNFWLRGVDDMDRVDYVKYGRISGTGVLYLKFRGSFIEHRVSTITKDQWAKVLNATSRWRYADRFITEDGSK